MSTATPRLETGSLPEKLSTIRFSAIGPSAVHTEAAVMRTSAARSRPLTNAPAWPHTRAQTSRKLPMPEATLARSGDIPALTFNGGLKGPFFTTAARLRAASWRGANRRFCSAPRFDGRCIDAPSYAERRLEGPQLFPFDDGGEGDALRTRDLRSGLTGLQCFSHGGP